VYDAKEDAKRHMRIGSLSPGTWIIGALVVLVLALTAQAAVTLAAGPEVSAQPQVVAQVPTPTPFRFLTPTPLVPGRTTTVTQSPPRTGGFPLELALPVLIGGVAAIGGGSFLLRRKTTR
jgi:hypothetical protein